MEGWVDGSIFSFIEWHTVRPPCCTRLSVLQHNCVHAAHIIVFDTIIKGPYFMIQSDSSNIHQIRLINHSADVFQGPGFPSVCQTCCWSTRIHVSDFRSLIAYHNIDKICYTCKHAKPSLLPASSQMWLLYHCMPCTNINIPISMCTQLLADSLMKCSLVFLS